MRKKFTATMFSALIFAAAITPAVYAEQSVDTEKTKFEHADRLIKTQFRDETKISEDSRIAVAYFVEKKVISGIEKNDGYTYFEPNGNLTRAQAAKIFAQGLNLQQKGSINFSDTVAHWANEEIKKVAYAKLITGKSSSKFAPNDQLTLAETSAILVRAFDIKEMANLSSVTDVQKHWAYDALSHVVAAGIVSPINNKLLPNQPVTRAQFAKMFYKGLAYANKLDKVGLPAETQGSRGINSRVIEAKEEYEVTAYEMYFKNFNSMVSPSQLAYKMTYGEEVRFSLGHIFSMDAYNFVSHILSSFKELGLSTSFQFVDGQQRLYITSKDPFKKLTVEPITAEIAKANNIDLKYSASAQTTNYIQQIFPKPIDFSKDTKTTTIKGEGVKTFTIEYNGKSDTVTLDGIFYSTDELLDAINKQTNQTKVKAEILYPNYMTHYVRFVASDIVSGSSIVIKGADDLFGDYKTLYGYIEK